MLYTEMPNLKGWGLLLYSVLFNCYKVQWLIATLAILVHCIKLHTMYMYMYNMYIARNTQHSIYMYTVKSRSLKSTNDTKTGKQSMYVYSTQHTFYLYVYSQVKKLKINKRHQNWQTKHICI